MTRRVAVGLGGLGLTGPLVRLVAGSHVSNAIGPVSSRAAAPRDPRTRGFWQPFVQSGSLAVEARSWASASFNGFAMATMRGFGVA